MSDTEFDPGKSLQDNVAGWVAALRVKVKACEKGLVSLDALETEFTKLQTTIENLNLSEFKKEFYIFRQEVQTAQAVAASKAKTTAAITAVVTSIVTGVIVALAINFLS